MKSFLRLIPTILIIFSIILVVLFEVSFLSVFHTLRLIDLSLILFVIVLVFAGLRLGVVTGITMGLVLDTFSPLSFGAYTIAFLVTGALVTVFSQNIFSDRNIISLLSFGVIATLVFHGVLFVVSLLTTLLDVQRVGIDISGTWFGLLGSTLLLNLIALLFVYLLGHFTRRFLQKRFLVIRS